MLSVEDALERTLEGLELASSDTSPTIWIAFSGGLDSSVLLDVVARRRACRAVHVHHGLDAGADGWQTHCEAFCRARGVPLEVVRVCVPAGNLEAEARRLRYEGIAGQLADGDVVLTAHHANDQAETRVWQLLTGRPTVGMPDERRLGVGRLVRPFLGVSRTAIRRYGEARTISWIDDPMNDDRRFDRVFIRRDLMPLIEAHDGNAVAKMAGQAPVRKASGGVVDWLEAALEKRLSGSLRSRLSAMRVQGAGAMHLDASLELLLTERTWQLRRRIEPAEFTGSCRVGQVTKFPGYGKLVWQRSSPGFRHGETLDLCNRRGVIQLMGQHKAVKDLLREAGLAPVDRRDWPVLVDGDRVVSVVGIATDEAVLVTNGYLPLWEVESRIVAQFFDAELSAETNSIDEGA